MDCDRLPERRGMEAEEVMERGEVGLSGGRVSSSFLPPPERRPINPRRPPFDFFGERGAGGSKEGETAAAGIGGELAKKSIRSVLI